MSDKTVMQTSEEAPIQTAPHSASTPCDTARGGDAPAARTEQVPSLDHGPAHPALRGIKMVALDLGGTLIDPVPDLAHALDRVLGGGWVAPVWGARVPAPLLCSDSAQTGPRRPPRAPEPTIQPERSWG